MFKFAYALTATLALAASALPAVASADTLALDTGTPSGSGFPMTLDSTDSYAAKFALGVNSTITGLAVNVAGNPDTSVGTTFTLSLYSDAQFGGLLDRFGATALHSYQVTYATDGLVGVSGLNLTDIGPGNYWLAVEVGGGDSATDLLVPTSPTGGTSPALAFAFNTGGGYQTSGAAPFSAQVSVVPVPAAAWLMGSGLLGLAGLRRRRVAAV